MWLDIQKCCFSPDRSSKPQNSAEHAQAPPFPCSNETPRNENNSDCFSKQSKKKLFTRNFLEMWLLEFQTKCSTFSLWKKTTFQMLTFGLKKVFWNSLILLLPNRRQNFSIKKIKDYVTKYLIFKTKVVLRFQKQIVLFTNSCVLVLFFHRFAPI